MNVAALIGWGCLAVAGILLLAPFAALAIQGACQ